MSNKTVDRFVFCTTKVFQDDRLTKIQLRVLLALYSFRSDSSAIIWPKRRQLSERVGYSEATVSKATTALVGLGWLRKVGDGGRSRPVHYELMIPDFGGETVSGSGTVPGSETVSGSDTKTVSGSDRGKELTSELTSKEKKINKKKENSEGCRLGGGKSGDLVFGIDVSMRPEAVSRTAAARLVEHCRSKGNLLTQSSFAVLMSEADRAGEVGMSADEVILQAVASGWRRFEISWFRKKGGQNAAYRGFGRSHGDVVSETIREVCEQYA